MDPAVRGRVLRQLSYGLYVITVAADAEVAAGALPWVTQTSLEPPLVTVGWTPGSGIALLSQRTGRFAVNILGAGQEQIARAFFTAAVRHGDTLNGVPFRTGNDGMPILTQVPAAFECVLKERRRLGDHELAVGEVTTVYEMGKQPPLLLATTGWFYGG